VSRRRLNEMDCAHGRICCWGFPSFLLLFVNDLLYSTTVVLAREAVEKIIMMRTSYQKDAREEAA
jgi:hypothetical protein